MLNEQQYQRWLRTSAPAEKCLLITLQSDVETIYLSSLAYISKPDDSLPSQPFRDCLTDMPELLDSGSVEVGDLEFTWPERVDALRAMHWRGYPYSLRLGAVDWSYDDFKVISSGFIEQIERSQRSRLRVDFAGAGLALEQPIATTRENDVLLPVCIGSVFGISPIRTDDDSLTYYVSDSPVSSIIVYVDEVAVSPTIDLALATITFSSDPEGSITADVMSSDTATVEKSIRWLADRRNLAIPVFDWFVGDQLAAEVGIYIVREDSYLSVLSDIADAVGAEITHDALGQMHVICIDYSRAAEYTITDDDIVIDSLSETGEMRELSALTLRYGKGRGGESKEIHLSNDANHYPVDWQETLELDSALTLKADAQAEASRLAAARFVRRIIYRMSVLLRGVNLKRGSRIRLQSDSWGIGSLATVTSIERLPGSNRYSIECIA